MRYFLSKRLPPFARVLLIESGNRELFEDSFPASMTFTRKCMPT